MGFPAKGTTTIPINPPPEEAVELKVRLIQKRKAASEAKKSKKKRASASRTPSVAGRVVKPAGKKAYVAAEHVPKGASVKVYA